MAGILSQFAVWRGGQISASELSDRVYAFTRGPARDLRGRYNARLDDMQVAYAVVTSLLPRDELPAELLGALQPLMTFCEREQAAQDQDAE